MYNDDDDYAANTAKKTALSAGLFGGLGAAGAKALRGERSLAALLRRASISGLGTAALAGSATYLGSKLLGKPEVDESSGATHRGGVGGLVGGGLVGGGLGYLAGTGKLRGLGKIAKSLSPELREELPINNFITDYLKKLAGTPSVSSGIKGSAVLGGVLGGGAGILGAEEGMDQDLVQHEIDAAKRRKMREAYSGGY